MKTILLVLLLLCIGCASPMAGARATYAASRAVYDATVTEYRAEQEACLSAPPPPEPCVAAVRERWTPVRKWADTLRSALAALSASVGLYDALSGAGRPGSLATVQKAVEAALDAAVGLGTALSELGAK